MQQEYGLLRIGVKVFKVLAWLSLVLQVVVGLILLFSGGPSVPFGAVAIPARLVGLLNCVAGAIYFFMFYLVANVIRLLLHIHERLHQGASGG